MGAAGIARADDTRDFELGASALDAGQYQTAADRFQVMLDPGKPTCDRGPSGACRLSDPALVERARVSLAIALVALNRRDKAELQARELLRNNPRFQPNPATVPQDVRDLIAEVRVKLQQELEQIEAKRIEQERLRRLAEQRGKEAEQRWIAELQRLAGQESVVERNSRLFALLPFGAGEFQNGHPEWGAIFAVTQVLTGATSIVAEVVAMDYASSPRIDDSGRRVDPEAIRQRIAIAGAINRVAFGAWAGLTAWSIVQAEVRFVPERKTLRQRPVPVRPPAPVIAPTVSALPGGAFTGLVGVF